MNSRLAVVRAKHLIDYIDVMREIGVPVDRALARSRLPTHIEELPDLYVSIPLGLEWVARTGHDLEPMELGLLAAQRAAQTPLRPAQQAMIMTAQTGLQRLEVLIKLSRLEDSALAMRLRYETDLVRVICDMGALNRHPFACLAEWLNLQAVISVVRSVAGPAWCPKELCFVARARLPATVQDAFPDARILLGQPHTSIVVERTKLALPTFTPNPSTCIPITAASTGAEQDDGSEFWSLVCLMRAAMQPYLSQGRPDIYLAAEISGMSRRTLQRKLALYGSSFSKILQEARFELACTKLADHHLKVIDVALMAGYESPQHFTRAFRQFTGITPTAFRDLGNR